MLDTVTLLQFILHGAAQISKNVEVEQKSLFCFWLTQAVKLNNDTVHVRTEILRYSLWRSGWNDNEYNNLTLLLVKKLQYS